MSVKIYFFLRYYLFTCGESLEMRVYVLIGVSSRLLLPTNKQRLEHAMYKNKKSWQNVCNKLMMGLI